MKLESSHRFLLVILGVMLAIGGGCTQFRENNNMNAATLEANKSLVRTFSEAENARNYDALDHVVANDIVRHSAASPDVQVTNREALKAFMGANATAFPDYTTSVEMIVAEGDLVAVYATFAGTMDGPMGDIPPTGNRLEMPFMALFRIEDGLIAEYWVEWDNINFLSQLGLFPPPGTGDANE